MTWTLLVLCLVIIPSVIVALMYFIEYQRFAFVEYDGVMLGAYIAIGVLVGVVTFTFCYTSPAYRLRAIHHYEKRLIKYEKQLETETNQYTAEYLRVKKIPQMKGLIDSWHEQLYEGMPKEGNSAKDN